MQFEASEGWKSSKGNKTNSLQSVLPCLARINQDLSISPKYIIIVCYNDRKIIWVARIFSVNIDCNIYASILREMFTDVAFQDGITLIEQFCVVGGFDSFRLSLLLLFAVFLEDFGLL